LEFGTWILNGIWCLVLVISITFGDGVGGLTNNTSNLHHSSLLQRIINKKLKVKS
jgi:hypothetical protein